MLSRKYTNLPIREWPLSADATKERIYNMMPYNIWIRDTVKCVRGRDIYGEKSGDRPTVTYNLYGGALKPALRPNPKTGCVLNTVL